ncbi:MAG: nitrophenyl compound nitroreductase subunit ArsF family protein [Chitinivibrionales bacterium]
MRVKNPRLVALVSPILVGVVIAGAFVFCQSAENKTSTENQATTKATESKNDAAVSNQEKKSDQKLMVYYFHTTYRCHSCNMIEQLTKNTVEKEFADELNSGRIEFKSINIEKPENKHFVKNYKLYTKSVVISDLNDGKEIEWKNLEKVWTLLRDQKKFTDYIQSEVKETL